MVILSVGVCRWFSSKTVDLLALSYVVVSLNVAYCNMGNTDDICPNMTIAVTEQPMFD